MIRDTLIAGRRGLLRIEANRFLYRREDGQTVDGEFSLEQIASGAVSILIGGRSYLVSPGVSGEVLVNGWLVRAEVFDPKSLRDRKAGAASGGQQEIAAPMPGKVVRVLVAPGDMVEAGQGVVVVEAMKMQNEMKSPKAGRVTEVRTRPGAAVLAGEALVIVE
jgi:acetyl/propionyl-CoA carboxylase alpha subunit